MKGRKKKISSVQTYITETALPPMPNPPRQDLAGSTISCETMVECYHHRDLQSAAAAAGKEKDGEKLEADDGHEEEEQEDDEETNEDEQLGVEEGGEEVQGEGEKSKLSEGYYEIEAICNKHIRKGQVQYLIKWYGLPESTNTWEPLENLNLVLDVVDAFEKRRNRKGENASSQNKTKQQEPPPAASTYNVPASEMRTNEEPLPLSSPNDLTVTNDVGSNGGGVLLTNAEDAYKEGLRPSLSLINDEKDLIPSLSQIIDKREQVTLNSRLSEIRFSDIKGTMATNADTDHGFKPRIRGY